MHNLLAQGGKTLPDCSCTLNPASHTIPEHQSTASSYAGIQAHTLALANTMSTSMGVKRLSSRRQSRQSLLNLAPSMSSSACLAPKLANETNTRRRSSASKQAKVSKRVQIHCWVWTIWQQPRTLVLCRWACRDFELLLACRRRYSSLAGGGLSPKLARYISCR